MNTTPWPRDGADGQRTLRLLILAPISLLLLTILVFSALAGSFNDSISAYYGGPARDVFVGCMVATALGLVAFRGTSDLEDLALNCAGFYAPIVAFVPFDFATSVPGVLVEGAADPTASLKVILVCYLVAALAFAVFDYAKGTWAVDRLWKGSFVSKLLVLSALLAVAFMLGLLLFRLFEPDTRFVWVHLAAAILLIVSLGISVASHLVPERHQGHMRVDNCKAEGGVATLYRTLVIGMALGLPLWWLLRWAGVSSALLWVETLELGLFIVFWAAELRRRWSVPAEASDDRLSPSPA